MKMRILLHAVLTGLLVSLSFAALAQEDNKTDGAQKAALWIQANGRSILGEADLQNMRFPDQAIAQAVFEQNVIKIKQDEKVQLKVEIIEPDGDILDVTNDAAIAYQALSPWTLTVSDSGLVAPATDAGMRVGIGDASVLIAFDTPAMAGWNKVFFKVVR